MSPGSNYNTAPSAEKVSCFVQALQITCITVFVFTYLILLCFLALKRVKEAIQSHFDKQQEPLKLAERKLKEKLDQAHLELKVLSGRISILEEKARESKKKVSLA